MFRTSLILITLVSLSGCGGGGPSDAPGTSSVSGTVTLDKKPLADAMVLFTPTEGGRPAVGTTDKNGKYTLQYSTSARGAVPGSYTVEIRTETTVSDKDGNDVTVPEKLPIMYHDNTELTADVKNESNKIDFALESGGEMPKPEEEEED
jgi:predicted small lipoprotein YifL